jgi:hypothetical protein
VRCERRTPRPGIAAQLRRRENQEPQR